MTEQERIEALLSDGGAQAQQQAADIERRTLMSIEKRLHQIRRLRWVVAGVWAALVVLLLIGGLAEAVLDRGVVTPHAMMVVRAALVIAVFLTVSLYVRSVSLRFETIQQALAAIQRDLSSVGDKLSV